MKLKTLHLDNKIKQCEQDLSDLYKTIPIIKQKIRILKTLKTKINNHEKITNTKNINT